MLLWFPRLEPSVNHIIEFLFLWFWECNWTNHLISFLPFFLLSLTFSFFWTGYSGIKVLMWMSLCMTSLEKVWDFVLQTYPILPRATSCLSCWCWLWILTLALFLMTWCSPFQQDLREECQGMLSCNLAT